MGRAAGAVMGSRSRSHHVALVHAKRLRGRPHPDEHGRRRVGPGLVEWGQAVWSRRAGGASGARRPGPRAGSVEGAEKGPAPPLRRAGRRWTLSEGDAVAAEAEWTSVETSGVTVEEAIAAALTELGAGAADVAVEVLSRPARVLPGERVSAAAEARVRVAKLDENTARARATLAELLERMGIAARIAARRAAATPGGAPAPPLLDISGDDLGLLIGWRGETLRALQTVVNLMMGDAEQASGRRVILDVERYRARREEQVR
ncbi:MAG TPA: hypothetical protein DCX12_08470, partial [Chloroflexi bacterium]|nr:hypothetical protein [Chloroflexota bacterium]HBV95118.1 hypothetical protein [Chloroflexota bacterium]